ncbi:MAG: Orotidine 5'-phosphate decarboxylase [uncultured Chloroflexi bacterium]|uniref:Orotidine 5'-phosphate decarboxylase n=1 Tax=uncultured Chloroflexota bacterium TaxID=166587 RepID=A0A6J4I8M1_9CHLR|nr:MAG: Orotidine 5'-phosphate decarboxylase [uncultured Chloroflexota bacterium]
MALDTATAAPSSPAAPDASAEPREPYFARLDRAARQNQSLLCVGLDVEPDRLPAPLRDLPLSDAIVEFNRRIVEATADLVACYKPNLAFYEALGPQGLEALRRTRALIPAHIPVIGDAKRGDIDNTMRKYAQALFDVYDFDAVTASPYLGQDAIAPFLSRTERGVYLLCRTSNPGSGEIADLDVGGRPLYLVIAERVQAWNSNHNAALVVGATYPQELARVRQVAPELPILLPGVGAQQGLLEESVQAGIDRQGGGLVVNAARQVLYASSGDDFPMAARQAALELRGRINRARGA